MKFYSQYGQDEWLYNTFYKDHAPGVFMEIGADDGIDKSNTLFFEETLGWSGICVEPSPSRFKLLQENRNCICERIALSDKIGTTQFLDIRGWGKGLSGIVENYCTQHSGRVLQELQHPENEGHEVITVNTDLLNNVLNRHGISEIDFCTIDTEGSEYEILRAFDFEKYKINIIMVENNYNSDKVKNLLTQHGYKHFHKLQIDDVYLLDEKK